jgi:hypothetical protein
VRAVVKRTPGSKSIIFWQATATFEVASSELKWPFASAIIAMVYDKGQPDLRVSLVAGAAGGLISDACVHPVDTVKTRLWCSSSSASASGQVAFRYNSFSHALTSIVKNEGARCLYKGFSSVALFTTVGHALYFGAYELGKTVAGCSFCSPGILLAIAILFVCRKSSTSHLSHE